MFRKSPINHLASAVLVLLFWALAILWSATYLGDSVSFQKVTSQDFQWQYRIVMTVLAVQAIALISVWLVYGSRESTSVQLVRAKRMWVAYCLFQLVVSICAVIVIAVLYLGELFEPMHYGVMLLMTSLETWIAFWVATLFFSPPIVEFVPLGKR